MMHTMVEKTRQPTGLRDITRDAVRNSISDVAVDLFAERGFDAVTVEDIAQAVGISARSFHRYFPAKEDAVLGDSTPWGELVRGVVAARPTDEPVWQCLRTAYEALLGQSGELDARMKRRMRVLGSTPSLRARNMEKHLRWEAMLTPLIAVRLPGQNTTIRARTIIQASLACWDIALATWAEEAETRSAGHLLALTFAELHPTPAGPGA